MHTLVSCLAGPSSETALPCWVGGYDEPRRKVTNFLLASAAVNPVMVPRGLRVLQTSPFPWEGARRAWNKGGQPWRLTLEGEYLMLRGAGDSKTACWCLGH
jgi:hypothetical protein